jgi:hypothetical protein
MEILKSCFSGVYNFKRLVKNENIFMTGTVEFDDLGNGKYRYNEKAIYVLHETPKNCFQTRFFIIKDTSLIIQKIDGSMLHEFQIHQGLSFPLAFHHVHQCKNDVYELLLNFLSKNQFKTTYKISGLKKR